MTPANHYKVRVGGSKIEFLAVYAHPHTHIYIYIYVGRPVGRQVGR